MDTNENSVIDDIYYAFLKKRNELNRLVKKNQEEIQETEALLKSLMETDVDMKYFSSRNTEDIYKNEISSAKDKIEHLIQENEMSISQMEELSKKIGELKIRKLIKLNCLMRYLMFRKWIANELQENFMILQFKTWLI